MEDDTNIATTSSSRGQGRGCGRGKRGARGGHKTNYGRSKLQNRFLSSNKWTQQEKIRLLEGLKRYGEDSDVLAQIVETRSIEEIEKKIRSITAAGMIKGTDERLEGSGVVTKAPLEAWLDLMQDLKFYEPQDYSVMIPEMLGLITRNEHFKDSNIPNLDWRKIYQFLTDVTDDKCTVTSLTDIESFVVLDLMHSLGDKLHASDTTEQRHALDLKYHLISFKNSKQNIAQALGNNFSDPEEVVQCISHGKSPELEATPHENTVSDKFLSPETNNPMTGNPETSMVGSLDSSSQHTTKDNNNTFNPCGNSPQTFSLNNPKGVTDDSAKVKAFVKPKLYTLNPLCITAEHLKLQPKSNGQ